MKCKSTWAALAAVTVVLISVFAQAQTSPSRPGSAAMVPEHLETVASHGLSLEQWADRVIRDGLGVAARDVREGRDKNGVVQLDARATVRRIVSDPASIDVCFETCLGYGRSTAVSCYVSCKAPKPPTVRP